MSSTDALSPSPAATIAEADAFCRNVAHRYGANFSVGFRFLPSQKRRAVYAVYAFCRWADDIADEEIEGAPGDAEAAIRLRMHRLDEWQRELDACYSGSPSHPITIALGEALRHFQIPRSAFIALIDGCRQDMVKTRYETFEELLGYCMLVASSISDLSLPIFGYRTGAAIGHGRSLATALQLTNVTRDVGDDLQRDRIYLPREEMRRFGVTEADLISRTESEPVRQLLEFQIARARSYFAAAEPLLQELAADARFPTILMGGIYATVLSRLQNNPFLALGERLRLTTLEKLMVVARRMLRPHFL